MSLVNEPPHGIEPLYARTYTRRVRMFYTLTDKGAIELGKKARKMFGEPGMFSTVWGHTPMSPEPEEGATDNHDSAPT